MCKVPTLGLAVCRSGVSVSDSEGASCGLGLGRGHRNGGGPGQLCPSASPTVMCHILLLHSLGGLRGPVVTLLPQMCLCQAASHSTALHHAPGNSLVTRVLHTIPGTDSSRGGRWGAEPGTHWRPNCGLGQLHFPAATTQPQIPAAQPPGTCRLSRRQGTSWAQWESARETTLTAKREPMAKVRTTALHQRPAEAPDCRLQGRGTCS